MEYKIVDGILEFENLSIGNLHTGEPLDWDKLRQIVLIATRHATDRPIKNRTLKQLGREIKEYIDQRDKVQTKDEQEKHNMEVQMRAYEYAIDQANQEIVKWRDLYVKAARNLQKYEDGV